MDILTTAGLVLGGLLALAEVVNIVGSAGEKIAKVRRAAKAPNDEQNARLDKLEERMGKVDAFLDIDKKRLDAFEQSNRVTQRALLALLEHGIDGNSVKRMQDSREELENHLINR